MLTREKITYQTRVLYDSPKLTSSFKDKAASAIEVQVWFQKELPYPDCDLTSLKPV